MVPLYSSVFASIIFAVCLSLAVTSKRCSQHEYDTWKFIKNLKEGYLKYKNYNDSRLCVNLRQLNVYNMVARFNSSFRTYADQDVHSEILLAKVQGCSNILGIYNSNDTSYYNATLEYSNEGCAIFKSRLVFPEPHCAVWVNNDAESADIDDCSDHFIDACVAEKRDVYPSDICGPLP